MFSGQLCKSQLYYDNFDNIVLFMKKKKHIARCCHFSYYVLQQISVINHINNPCKKMLQQFGCFISIWTLKLKDFYGIILF